MKLGFVSLFVFATLSVVGQSFQKITYGVKEGLLTHLTKSVEVDSLGFVWLGTDEGLVKFDGKEFTSFRDATQSRFVKKITKIDNELWVLSDLGLTKIHSYPDTVYFEKIIDGIRFSSDSLLHYPKNIFQDSKSRIWITEPDKIALVNKDKSIRKFEMPGYSFSDSFFRSYSLFEFSNQLYAVSYQGQFFRFEKGIFKELNAFSHVKLQNVNTVKVINEKIIIGDYNGLSFVDINGDDVNISRIKNSINEEVSDIISYQDNILTVGTFGDNIYLVSLSNWEVILKESAFRINYFTASNNNEIWAGSDEGALLFKKNYFNPLLDRKNYIESIWSNAEAVYYCHKGGLYRIDETVNGFKKTPIHEDDNEYFISITGNEQTLWVSNKNVIWKYEEDHLVEKIGLDEEYFIFNILIDSKNRLWVNQDNTTGPLIIFNDNSTKIDYRNTGGLGRIEVIKESNTGDIYLGGTGFDKYLFRYEEANGEFINLSQNLDFVNKNDFEVSDLLVENDTVWLATSAGLIVIANGKVSRLNLGKSLSEMPAKSIQKSNETIWLSNSAGIISYNIETGETITFDESTGLNSRSGNSKAFLIDKNLTKWVGTAKGLAYSKNSVTESFTTKRPIITGIDYNDLHLRLNSLKSLVVDNGAYIKVNFISLNMPGNSIEYEYRSGKDSVWTNIGNRNYIESKDLSYGDYSYQIRARQQGNYSWSEVAEIKYRVNIPQFLQVEFVVGYLFLTILVAFASIKYNKKRIKKLEQKLNAIVEEKTEQIRATNEELKQTNKELDMFVYSASHDMKAPLASLLGLLNIYDAETSTDNRQDLIKMMRSSIQKLDAFLREVIDYSKNSRLGVSRDQVSFNEIIQELLDSFQYLEEYGKVEVIVDDQVGAYRTDKNRIRIILNNLVSNSIRYMDPNKKKSWVKISVYKTNRLFIEVEDNGVGIKSEYQDRIFEMFYRANETKTGSGLGLYIVKESIRNLEGLVSVQSEYGNGSKFTISLPL